MRFKIDENLHDDVAAMLVAAGHDAQTVHAEGLRGCDDAILASHCLTEDRAIVTLDLDFADIRAFPPASGAGIIVLRVRDQSRPHILDVLNRAIILLQSANIAGQLWVVTEAGVRIRGGPIKS
jgi:predicted nuclease of predicted toxin-antitoxin system